MKLIAGLGNPGDEYVQTRHNIGFAVVDQIARNDKAHFQKGRGSALQTKIAWGNESVILVKPQDYMNRSGFVVWDYLRYYDCGTDDLLVIHDDLDHPLATLRLAYAAGAAGHNGVTSIIEAIGHNCFYRLRCGIGRPRQGDPTDYVLGRFNKEEESILQSVLAQAAEASKLWVTEGAKQVQQIYHSSS